MRWVGARRSIVRRNRPGSPPYSRKKKGEGDMVDGNPVHAALDPCASAVRVLACAILY